jgi:hypothetical protein
MLTRELTTLRMGAMLASKGVDCVVNSLVEPLGRVNMPTNDRSRFALGGGAIVYVDGQFVQVDSRSPAAKPRAAKDLSVCTALIRRGSGTT